MASVSLSDLFDTVGFRDYDHAVTDTITDHTIANRVINLRSFNDSALVRLATQGDLDGQLQFDGETQAQIEFISIVPGEGWAMLSHTNVNAWATPPTSSEVGKQSASNNFYGAALTLSGGAPDVTIGSNMDANPIDISTADFVSLTATTQASATISVYLEDSVGGNSGFVALTKQGGTPSDEWRAPIGSFTGLNLASVTRAQIHVTQVSGTNGAVIRIFALRAYKTGYDPSVHVGINTINKAVEFPVPLNLNITGGPYNQPLIRGRGQPGDPSPENAELRMLVELGTLSTTNNTVSLIYRQIQGADTYVRVAFTFKQASASYTIFDRVAGVETPVVSNVTIPEWATIRAAGFFWIAGSLIDNTFQFQIYISDVNEEVLALAHAESPVTYSALVKRRGRIGWSVFLTSYDTFLRQFQGIAFTFSTFVTKTNVTITPIEAVQLKAAAAADSNLFTSFVSGATFDTVKTLSGNGSWAGFGPAISNQFVIDDFAVTYIKFDIWVPTGSAGDPYISLRPLGSASNIYLPAIDDLQPGIWNNVEIELSQYAGLIGVPYELHIADLTEENPLTWQFNIDNMMIGRRNVAWFASPDDGVNWYEFRDAINDDDAALHFPRVNVGGAAGRGNALKFRAEARSVDAWVASFAYKIQYAQLGRPTYYV